MTTTTTKAEIETTEDAKTGITANLIKLMKKADRIVFMIYQKNGEQITEMRIIREEDTKVSGQRVPVELTHTVMLNGEFNQRTYFRQDEKAYNFAAAHLYVYDKGIRSNDDIHTWLAFLKPGDVLVPTFYPDAHMNDYMAAATTKDGLRAGEPLHCDVFRCHVTRNPKLNKWQEMEHDTYSFNLALSICPNNSARMCRER